MEVWNIPDNTKVRLTDIEGQKHDGTVIANYGTFIEFTYEGEDTIESIMHDVITGAVRL